LTLKKGVVPVFLKKISPLRPLRPLRQKISVAYFSGTASGLLKFHTSGHRIIFKKKLI
jgi:hypothetical protein